MVSSTSLRLSSSHSLSGPGSPMSAIMQPLPDLGVPGVSDTAIDPVLLGISSTLQSPGVQPCSTSPIDSAQLPTPTTPSSASATLVSSCVSNNEGEEGIKPRQLAEGILCPQGEFTAYLLSFKRKDRLRKACSVYGLKVPQSANLDLLRTKLVEYWYPAPVSQRTQSGSTTHTPTSSPTTPTGYGDDNEDDDDTLVAQYDVEGAGGIALLGYDRLDGLEEEDEELDDDLADPDTFKTFRIKTRVDAAKLFEDNRRAGGKKTQQANVKAWNLFIEHALAKGHVRDRIVDEHALLLYVKHTAERQKRNRRGEDIPGTRVGASQIKKEFFGALRIRKVQDAHDPSLARRRPATTVHVYDVVKAHMDEALKRARLGLIPAQDAPDIVANTFLEQVTDEQLDHIRIAFLGHRELHSTIKGFLAWTLCSASGNRGDDVRALKLCELQPYILMHPNKHTQMPAVLGLQAEDKAGQRGMKTTINPRYTCWIAHRDPQQCPLGALAFLLHFVHDHFKLTEKLDIQWSVNKSWRQVRLLFGSSPNVPYNDHNLYNLYCQAYKKAGFESGIKAHLPRHNLGYQQERLGVESSETARLGWSRNTYTDVYAPSLPKKAILACHGYMEHEEYTPTRCKITVPSQFLARVCPMAEEVISSIKGMENLVGATNHWKMVIVLRPHLFLCAAALFQKAPDSPIFRLPALAHDDVRLWMRTEFPAQLVALEAAAGDPVSLERLQNSVLKQSLQHLVVSMGRQADEVARLRAIVQRRTAAFSPPKVPIGRLALSGREASALGTTLCLSSTGNVAVDGLLASSHALGAPLELVDLPPSSDRSRTRTTSVEIEMFVDAETRARQDTGTYRAEDSTFRAFVAPSPSSPVLARPRTEVDLVLPPALAFTQPGHDARLPDFGTGSVTWDAVFQHVTKSGAAYLWEVWKPSRSLEQSTIHQIWECYNTGEVVRDSEQNPIAMKPPLRLVEQRFLSGWRKTAAARKAWQRFREIPEWIDETLRVQRITPEDAIAQLQAMRLVPGSTVILGLSSLVNMLAAQRKAAAQDAACARAAIRSSSPSSVTASSLLRSSPPPTSPASTSASFPRLAESTLIASDSVSKRKRAPAFGVRSKKRKQLASTS